MDAGAVIDNIMHSIMAMLPFDFMGRGELAASQQKLAQIFSRLTNTVNYYNDAVYMTNQVMDDPIFFTLRSLMSHTKKSLTDTKGPSEG
ncbi:RecA recombinase Rhp51 [Orobanche hederae]